MSANGIELAAQIDGMRTDEEIRAKQFASAHIAVRDDFAKLTRAIWCLALITAWSAAVGTATLVINLMTP